MIKFKILFAAFSILAVSGSYAQSALDTEKVSARFNLAIQLYDSSEFESAAELFDGIINQNENY